MYHAGLFRFVVWGGLSRGLSHCGWSPKGRVSNTRARDKVKCAGHPHPTPSPLGSFSLQGFRALPDTRFKHPLSLFANAVAGVSYAIMTRFASSPCQIPHEPLSIFLPINRLTDCFSARCLCKKFRCRLDPPEGHGRVNPTWLRQSNSFGVGTGSRIIRSLTLCQIGRIEERYPYRPIRHFLKIFLSCQEGHLPKIFPTNVTLRLFS